eukprot:3475555-Rhodomonas_salina.1
MMRGRGGEGGCERLRREGAGAGRIARRDARIAALEQTLERTAVLLPSSCRGAHKSNAKKKVAPWTTLVERKRLRCRVCGVRVRCLSVLLRSPTLRRGGGRAGQGERAREAQGEPEPRLRRLRLHALSPPRTRTCTRAEAPGRKVQPTHAESQRARRRSMGALAQAAVEESERARHYK